MRKITLAVLVFSGFIFNLQAQLKWLNPRPSGYPNSKIVFINSTTGFILNTNGDLIKTGDQGQNWKLVKRFSNMYCMMMKDSTGIIAGYGTTIYKSADNGNSWDAVSINTGNSPSFKDVDIISRDTIILATGNNLYKSVNRGVTWQPIAVPTATTINCVDFIDSQNGFLGLSERSILKTSNGGTTWQETAIADVIPSGILSMKFLDRNTGYAFRQSNTLLKSTDGGQNWTSTFVNGDIFSIDFPTALTGYIGGALGALYVSDDGGASWSFAGTPPFLTSDFDIKSLYFLNADVGFAVGSRGRILKTTNHGVTWSSYSTIYTDVFDFSFPDPATGYAISGSRLYKTTDSSKTWSLLDLSNTLGSNNVFDKLIFFSKDTGIVTSTNSAKVHTTSDGGLTWQTVNPTGYYGYDKTSDINFINGNVGFICNTTDNGYHISKTTDRGKTWKNIDSNLYYGQVFYKIQFLDEKKGYASRYSQVYKTIDSAKTWTLFKDNDFHTINCMWFFDERSGLIGDDYGLKRTADSGKTWTTLNFTYSDQQINRINFLTSAVGYLTCSSGAIYQTADSGITWALYGKAPGYNTYYNIKFNGTNAYFGGSSGAILASSAKYIISPDYVCNGSKISFTSDISGTAYSWEISGDGGTTYAPVFEDGFIFTGTKTSALSIMANTAMATRLFRCVVNGNKFSKTYQIKFQSRWLGTVDNSWENPQNWSCNAIPGLNDDVLIGNGDINIHSDVQVHSLKLLPGASIIIDPGFHLTVTQ